MLPLSFLPLFYQIFLLTQTIVRCKGRESPCFDNSLLFIFDFSDLFDQAALILPTDTTH